MLGWGQRYQRLLFSAGWFSGSSPQEAAGTLELLRGVSDTDRDWQVCAPGSMRRLSQKLFLFKAFLTFCHYSRLQAFCRVPPASPAANKGPSVTWLLATACSQGKFRPSQVTDGTEKSKRGLGTEESWGRGQGRFAPELYHCLIRMQMFEWILIVLYFR